MTSDECFRDQEEVGTEWNMRFWDFKKAGVAVVLMLALLGGANAGTFEDGYAAYERGDYATAYRILSPIAEQGDAGAQFYLGNLYNNGKGVPQNDTKAARWWRRAAEQGHAEAQYNLGDNYSQGQGVTQDYAKAAHWWRKAAEQGDAEAQFNLGVIYVGGHGVQQSYGQATHWLRRAANQGNQGAQFTLGILYSAGEGVPKDYVTAYKWFNLAASGRTNNAKIEATKLRDAYAEGMTSSQIAEAQRLSRNFVARPEQSKGGPEQKSASADQEAYRKFLISMQKALQLMGYYSGSVDGLSGPKTKAAIKAFQRDVGLPVDGVIDRKSADQILLQLKKLRQKRQSTPKLTSTGSGFVINQEGYVVTNYHVVDDCKVIKSPMLGSSGVHDAVSSGGGQNSIVGTIVATDPANDLALVDLPGSYQHFARFRNNNRMKLGETVMVAGFPLRGLLADDLNVATGEISALSGIRGDAKDLQISAPVQQGNSGGPLLDRSGNVIGVVVSKLDAMEVAKKTGDIPQNVNFAIKSAVARFLLDIHNADYQTSDATGRMGTAEIAAQARRYTVVLECWK